MLGRVENVVCEEHLWVLGGIDLRMTGASAWWRCVLCEEVDMQWSQNADYVDDAVSDFTDGTT